jgi:hypothetical protein
MATTPNFGWPTPDDTDLVRNGAAAIRSLGDAIDNTVDNIQPSPVEIIADLTLTANQTQITFDNIPADYQHLRLVVTGQTNNTGATSWRVVRMRFNNDDGATQYVQHYIQAEATSLFAAQTSTTFLWIGGLSPNTADNQSSSIDCHIYDYKRTNFRRRIASVTGWRSSATNNISGVFYGEWLNTTNAITRIDLTLSSNDFLTATNFVLYGIKG